MKVDTGQRPGQEGPGGRARVPPRQPPARLPGVRQGRRVPAAGPDLEPRPRREPLRRGEAPLREADPDQRPRVPRPGALHPVRPLHALRRGGGRRPADPLHAPRQRDAGADVPRRAVRVVLQRQHRADLPGRRAHGQALPVQGPAVGPLGRPRARARRARSAAASRSQSSRDEVLRYQGVDRDPVNWGWLCDRAASTSRPSTARTASAHRSCARATSWSRCRGTRRSTPPPAALARRHRRRRAGRGRRHRRRPRHQRGRLRLGQAGQGRHRHRPRRRPARRRPATRAVLGLPPATIDEVGAATTIVLLGPDLKEELPVLYLRLRDAAETPQHAHRRARRPRHRAHALRVAIPAPPSRRAGRARAGHPRHGPGRRARHRRGAPDLRARAARRAARWSWSLGRPNLADSPAFTVDAAAALLAALPDAIFLPALRRGNVRGALDAGMAPGLLPGRTALADAGPVLRRTWNLLPAQPGLDTAGILRGGRRRRIGCLVLLGADPLADFPDATWPAAGWPAPGGSSPSTRSSPSRPARPTSCWRPPRSARRRAPPPTSRAGSPHGAEGHAAGHGARRLDDRRRARRPPRRTTSACRPSRRSAPRSPPCRRSTRTARCRPARRRGASAARRSAFVVPTPVWRRPLRAATTSGSWSTASCTTPPPFTAHSPSLAGAGPRAPRISSTRGTPTASASPTARRVRVVTPRTEPGAGRPSRPARVPRGMALRGVQPARRRRQRAARRPAPSSPTCGSEAIR